MILLINHKGLTTFSCLHQILLQTIEASKLASYTVAKSTNATKY